MSKSLPNLPFAVFDEFGQGCEDRVADHYRAAVAAQPEAGEAAGWKRVPIEPTSNMLAAMSGEWHSSRHEEARKQYAAMIASAPTIQPTQPVQEREAFEAWAASKGYESRTDDGFDYPLGRVLWEAWQAARATPAQAGDAGEPSDGERLTFEADPELTPAAFAERLARHMKVASLTAKEVSELTGVSETTLSRLKNHGRMPDAISYAALCNFMGWHPHIRHRLAIRATKGGKL